MNIQYKYFSHLKTDEDIERHGLRVFRSIGFLVKACKEEDDDRSGVDTEMRNNQIGIFN